MGGSGCCELWGKHVKQRCLLFISIHPPTLPTNPIQPTSAYIDNNMTGAALDFDGRPITASETSHRPLAMHAFDRVASGAFEGSVWVE
jgi:hypothetical protein